MIYIFSMKFDHAVRYVIEYVQGHTALKCAAPKWSTQIIGSGETQAKALCAEERLNNVHPAALFIDRMTVEITAPIILPDSGKLPEGEWWSLVDVFEHAEISYITCRFLYEMPSGGKNAAMRIFAFRNGMLRQVA